MTIICSQRLSAPHGSVALFLVMYRFCGLTLDEIGCRYKEKERFLYVIWLKLVYFDLLRLAMELCQLQHPDHGRRGAATDRASDRYRVMQIPWDSNRRFGWG